MGSRFTRRREDFVCGHCQAAVRGDGYTNHCPACLWSRHVDVQPGDRAATCSGMMAPIGALWERGRYVVVSRCLSCGHLWRNRAADRDRREVLLSLFGQPVPDPAPGRATAAGPDQS